MPTETPNGYTLIEIIVAMSIFVIVTLMSGDYIIRGLTATRFNQEQDTAIQEARRGVENFTKEVRGANASERGDYPILKMDDGDITFFTDTDYDDRMDRVRYFLKNETFYRVVTPPNAAGDYTGPSSTSTISIYVTNDAEPVFMYFDNTDTETAVINRIRLIRITLVINVTEQAPNEFVLQSDVHLRNLKDNL